MMTPPTTNAETGTWDDSGSIRGWTFRLKQNQAQLLDLVLEDKWTAHDFTCLLIRVTEYFERGRHTQTEPDHGEGETYYRGYVHAPNVDSFSKGYCGTYIVDCHPDDGWFVWDERSWSNRPGYTQSMQESARGKTERLAEGLAKRQRGEL